MDDYVAELDSRITGWYGLPLTQLGERGPVDCDVIPVADDVIDIGRLIDVATMMTDDHHGKRNERYIMLFQNALVTCKWKSSDAVIIKRMCLMDKVSPAEPCLRPYGAASHAFSNSFSSTR